MFDTQLTTFPGPPENPLYESGAWAQTGVAAPMQKGTNSATDSIHGNPNYSYWTRDVFFADTAGSIAEVFGCIEGGQLGAALETWRVFLLTDPINFTGYLVYNGGGLGKDIVIRRYTNFSPTFLAGAGTGYPAKLGLRINGTQIEAWDSSDGITWNLRLTVTDTTHRGAFFAGIGVEDPTAGGLTFSCFGARAPNRTQFFRWTSGRTQ